ncbi:hypothetical protein GGTG_01469 [Gaeumannomyces tritici R3-111a-1]|uniref:Uncharacterized protein n=1 Tax=Gaeumannomyces tritici (strain R3-111a-1) TaxID=644352 RepID=J3NJN9_GAET3|nr:hypothetical protein GGTG_01469 [Gaeumannomyces tritici R3-111a-1]EJT81491.1 hypothetical protein GGTG_01469 [Gaeumannomyces tritici R3-111a-1]
MWAMHVHNQLRANQVWASRIEETSWREVALNEVPDSQYPGYEFHLDLGSHSAMNAQQTKKAKDLNYECCRHVKLRAEAPDWDCSSRHPHRG